MIGKPCAYVYILANRRNGALYVGFAADLEGRISEHKQYLLRGFTRRYGVTTLVWYEECATVHEARDREHSINRWRRAWKLRLIEEANPNWIALAAEWNLG